MVILRDSGSGAELVISERGETTVIRLTDNELALLAEQAVALAADIVRRKKG